MTINRAELFKLGDQIDISRINKNENKKLYYPSQILDVLDDDVFIISGPIYKNKLVFLHKGEKISVSCIVEDRGKYAFEAIVLERYNGKIYRLKIQKISGIEKFQQRNFYRLEIGIPVNKIFETKKDNDEYLFFEECKSKDISGSGMKLYSNYEHNEEDIIICDFNIDEDQITTKAKVVRIEKIDSFEYDYNLGIYFLDLCEIDRDKIIKFIFKKQRELRKKGMI